MYKIGVIGDADTVTGFRALGIQVFPVSGPQEAQNRLKELADGGYALIYITEQAAGEIGSLISEYESKMLPAIVLIPGLNGASGHGLAAIRDKMIKAVGTDIFGGKQ